MPHIPNPVLPSRTAFWSLGFRFDMIGRDFQNIANAINGIWLLGVWLSWPFYIIGWGFFEARNKCWDADSLIVSMKGWLDALTSGWAILDILKVLSYNIRFLVDNPRGFVRYYIELISTALRNIIINPNWWFTNKLRYNFPLLWSVVYDTINWLRNKVFQLFPGLVTFFISPVHTVLGWIRYHWPFIPRLISNPVSQIVDWLSSQYPGFVSFLRYPTNYIIGRLSGRTPTLAEFLLYPITWLKRQMSIILNISEEGLSMMPVSLLRWFFNILVSGTAVLINTVTTLLCDIILEFI